MKKYIVIMLLLIASVSHAGQRAITDGGDEVILNDDGTWVYAESTQTETDNIATNPTKFAKPKQASFLLKSNRNNACFWINTDKWSFQKAKQNPEAEYQFNFKGHDLYAMAFAEGIEIPIESLSEIALNNARNAAPDIRIIQKEFRVVNGRKVIFMELSGTIQGIKFSYLGYYHSNPSGSTQLIAYTAANLVDRYRPELIDFLNGFDVRPPN